MGVTHEVTNQVPPLIGHDPIAGDAVVPRPDRGPFLLRGPGNANGWMAHRTG